MSILDLPESEQIKHAKDECFATLEEWQAHTRKVLADLKSHSDSLTMINYNDLSPEEQAAHRRWGEKVASGNPR